MVTGDDFSDQSMSDRGEPEPPCLILDFGLRILDFWNWCIFVSDFEFRFCNFIYTWRAHVFAPLRISDAKYQISYLRFAICNALRWSLRGVSFS